MDVSVVVLLVVAGFLGGVVNALAGGATLITFPAMLAAGLPPVVANASNAVAIAPGHLLAGLADREKIPASDREFLLSLILGAGGGAIGASLLLALPERLFVLPVPALIGFATLLFASSPRIAASKERGRPRQGWRSRFVWLAGSSIYGGFFGAGLGVILTAVLSIDEPNDLRKVKAQKNVLATAVSLAAVAIFIAKGAVAWRPTLIMLGGALAGGYVGGLLIRVLPAAIVRWFVLATGTLMTIVYALRYWF